MSIVLQSVSRVNAAAALVNDETVTGSVRGTYYDLNRGGHIYTLTNDDICVDDWESNQTRPVVSEARAPGALLNADINFDFRRATYYDSWVGRHMPAIRGTSCGTGFTGVYVEAPRLLIDAGGTGGVSGVAGGARRSFH